MTRQWASACAAGLVLLCGCGQSAVRVEAVPEALPPETLTVWAEKVAGGRALVERYCESRGLELLWADSAETADFCLLENPPEGDGWRTLSDDPLLAAGLGRAEPFFTLPLGGTAWGWVADSTVLTALLSSDALGGVQNASWVEWQSFVTVLADWLDSPAETAVTLGGVTYTLPAARTADTLLLETVFALPQSGGHSGPALAPVLAVQPSPNETLWTAAWNAFALEAENGQVAADPLELLRAGTAVLCKSSLAEAAVAFADAPSLAEQLALVPFCFDLPGETVGPVWAEEGWLAISTEVSDEAAARGEGFILWVYAADAGRQAVADCTGLLAPGETAAQNALGQSQLAWSRGGTIAAAPEQSHSVALEAAWETAETAADYARAATAALG